MTRLIISLLLTFSISSTSFAGVVDQEVAALLEMNKNEEMITVISKETLNYLESSLTGEDFLENKSFSEIRTIKAFSSIIMKYLDNKYSTNYYKYKSVVKDDDLSLYEKAYRVYEEEKVHRPYYYCSDGNLQEAKELRKRVHEVRKNKNLTDEDKFKKALNLCKYVDDNYYLIDEYYSSRKLDEQYKLMLRLIKEDQREYDFLYKNENELDYSFANKYQEFLINGLSGSHISKSDLILVTKKLLDTQAEIFNVDNMFYRVKHHEEAKGNLIYPMMLKAADSIVSLCTALEAYGFNDYSVLVVKKFVTGTEFQKIINNEHYYVEFRNKYNEYLQEPIK